jgi:hemerythrin superfamily protein
MDVLDLLTADHNRVRGLFDRFREAEEAVDTATMAEVASKIAEELTVHTTVEEEVFYPWARGVAEEVSEVVDEGIEEHHVAKILLEEVTALSPGADEWTAKMKVLMENVEHHAEEEESEMFPKIRSGSQADDRKAQGDEIDARKRELGAPVPAHAEGMTKEQLIDLAAEQHIPGRSKMDRDELAATVDAR